jgi:hypothetical protein
MPLKRKGDPGYSLSGITPAVAMKRLEQTEKKTCWVFAYVWPEYFTVEGTFDYG